MKKASIAIYLNVTFLMILCIALSTPLNIFRFEHSKLFIRAFIPERNQPRRISEALDVYTFIVQPVPCHYSFVRKKKK